MKIGEAAHICRLARGSLLAYRAIATCIQSHRYLHTQSVDVDKDSDLTLGI